ncbi:MAG: glycosyl transferase [Saprospiraceae bacterium]|nr:glycosyl transferase [Saprospiraceae bacterium]
MKILYSIQGTGNGHLSRAISIHPYLSKYAAVDYLISGSNFSLNAPFDFRYHLQGISFKYNSKGGIDYLSTLRNLDLKSFHKEIDRSPVEDYDLVINDFEPISAWACNRKNVPCIAMSHQASFLSSKTPIPANSMDIVAQMVLKKFAPAHDKIGFHFKSYDQFIYTPVIKDAIREANIRIGDHITVYLPSFGLFYLRNLLSSFTNYQFQVFHAEVEEDLKYKNIEFKGISQMSFNESLINCKAVIANAGFEIPSEAFYLGKPMILIPIQRQFEQICNATAASLLGAQVIFKLGDSFRNQLEHALQFLHPIKLNFPLHFHLFIEDALEKADRIRAKIRVKTI